MIGISWGIATAAPRLDRYYTKSNPASLASVVLQSLLPKKPSSLNILLKNEDSYSAQSRNYKTGFPAQKDNLVFIVSESTRADVLETSIAGKAVTPNWRALATEGSVGKSYYSHTGFTTSSLKALFRGTLGTELPLGGTLFEILKKQGYQIAIISGQDESFGNISKDTAMEKSADIFFDARSAKEDRVFSSAAQGSLTLSNDRVVRQMKTIANQLDWSRPVFLYINLQSGHFPYFHQKMPLSIIDEPLLRRNISENARPKLIETYLNAVAYADWATGEIVEQLKQYGVYDRTLITVSGDHGESLFDDGILGHGIKITDKQMHAVLVSNRKIPALDGLIGQQNLAKYILQRVGVKFDPELASDAPPVIQIIGDLSNPSSLGYVYKNGERLTIDIVNDEVQASWLSEPVSIATIMQADSKERSESMKLAKEWAGID